jgi:hypothetical protein
MSQEARPRRRARAEAPPAERHELDVRKTAGFVPYRGRHEHLMSLGFRDEARGDEV